MKLRQRWRIQVLKIFPSLIYSIHTLYVKPLRVADHPFISIYSQLGRLCVCVDVILYVDTVNYAQHCGACTTIFEVTSSRAGNGTVCVCRREMETVCNLF